MVTPTAGSVVLVPFRKITDEVVLVFKENFNQALRCLLKAIDCFRFQCLLGSVLVGLSGCTGGKVTAQIQDDAGRPVADAKIKVSWTTNEPWGPSLRSGNPHEQDLTSSLDGRFSLSLPNEVTFLGVTKPGYYATGLSFLPNQLPKMPVIIPLLRILRPQPMVGKRALIHIQAGSFQFEYDLLAGDCLPPHGAGSVADLLVEWRKPDQTKGEYPRDVISVRLIGDGNGTITQRIKYDPNAARSPLRSRYEAPGGGYAATFADADQICGGFAGEYYGAEKIRYFKIRSGIGPEPLFGKMRGDINYIPRPLNGNDEFEFEYVINPSGDRGLEMDMKRITMPSKHELEYPPGEF